MTELEKMWTALSAHQPIADRMGYGTQWQCMCNQRTTMAADAAHAAATGAVKIASNAAAAAAYAARLTIDADYYFNKTIAHITKANGEQA